MRQPGRSQPGATDPPVVPRPPRPRQQARLRVLRVLLVRRTASVADPSAQKPRYALTRGSIRSGVQNGDHTRLTDTSVTPGRVFSWFSASDMISGPEGQPGDVSDMSIDTAEPSTRIA